MQRRRSEVKKLNEVCSRWRKDFVELKCAVSASASVALRRSKLFKAIKREQKTIQEPRRSVTEFKFKIATKTEHADDDDIPCTTPDPTGLRLIQLPQELVTAIVSSLSNVDQLCLGLTSRTLYAKVSKPLVSKEKDLQIARELLIIDRAMRQVQPPSSESMFCDYCLCYHSPADFSRADWRKPVRQRQCKQQAVFEVSRYGCIKYSEIRNCLATDRVAQIAPRYRPVCFDLIPHVQCVTLRCPPISFVQLGKSPSAKRVCAIQTTWEFEGYRFNFKTSHPLPEFVRANVEEYFCFKICAHLNTHDAHVLDLTDSLPSQMGGDSASNRGRCLQCKTSFFFRTREMTERFPNFATGNFFLEVENVVGKVLDVNPLENKDWLAIASADLQDRRSYIESSKA